MSEADIRARAETLPDIRVRGWQKIAADVGKIQVRDDGTSDAIDKWIASAVHAHNDRRDLLALLDAEREKVARLKSIPHDNSHVFTTNNTCPKR